MLKGFEDPNPRHGARALAVRTPGALAGWGDLEAQVAADRAGIAGRTLLPGMVSHDDVAGWLAAADVVAVPSVRDDAGNVDGLPNVLLEALASGTPVVATGLEGIGAAVVHERTGLLVEERDPAGLAAAIERLLDTPDLAAELVRPPARWPRAGKAAGQGGRSHRGGRRRQRRPPRWKVDGRRPGLTTVCRPNSARAIV